MNNLQYDSVYKFIVSVGIAIVIIPFLLLFNFLKYDDVVLLKSSEIEELTEIGKEIVNHKQNLIIDVVNNRHIITLICFAIGIAIILFGLIKWYKNIDEVVNKTAQLDLYLKELNIKKLTGKELIKKTEEGFVETNYSNDEDRKSIYSENEQYVLEMLQKVFKPLTIVENVRFNRHLLDAFIPHSADNMFAKAFEIKILNSRGLTVKSLEVYKKKLESFAEEYYTENSLFCIPCLIILVENYDKKFEIENHNIIKKINEYNADNYKGNFGQIYLCDKNGLENNLKTFKNKYK